MGRWFESNTAHQKKLVKPEMNVNPSLLSKIIQLHKDGNFLKSKSLILEILKKDKNNPEILKLLSFTELQIGNTDESIRIINKAINFKKENAELYLLRGYANMKKLDYQFAITDFEKTININPRLKDAYLNIGVIYSELKDFKKSLKYLLKVIDIDPNDYRAFLNIAYIKSEMNEYDEALKEINKSIQINDRNLAAYLLRGNFYKQLNKLKLSMADFDKVILESKQTNNQKIYHEALYNKSLLKLLCGEFEEGWKLYENRFYIDQHENFERFKTEKIFSKIPKKNIPFPKNVEEFKDSELLIISEQGIGEHIIFLPLVSEVSKLTKSTTLLIDSRLIPLCERSFKNINFLPLGDKNISDEMFNKKVSLLKKINFDYQISTASLPKFFRNKKNDFEKNPHFFFKTNDNKMINLKKELNLDPKKKIIGISWTSFNSALRYLKNIDLIQMGSIFKDLDITLLNLQYGDVDDEIDKFVKNSKIPIINIKSFDMKDDLDSLVCLIDLCDLVISTDNITIRLAGSINKETWVMLPKIPQFFYQLDRSDCLWLPSLKLYRQDKRSDWSKMLLKIKNDLLNRYN